MRNGTRFNKLIFDDTGTLDFDTSAGPARAGFGTLVEETRFGRPRLRTELNTDKDRVKSFRSDRKNNNKKNTKGDFFLPMCWQPPRQKIH